MMFINMILSDILQLVIILTFSVWRVVVVVDVESESSESAIRADRITCKSVYK